MKSKIKYILVVFLLSFLITNIVFSQTFLGNYEIFESNGELFHEAGTNDTRIDTDHVILKYQINATESSINNFEQNNYLKNIGKHKDYYMYKLPANASYLSFCQGLSQNSLVSYIEPSFYFEYFSTFTPNDPDVGDLEYLEILQVYEAWGITTGDSNVIVAVLDSGLEFTDEEFGPDDTPIANLHFNNPDENDWDDWDDPESGDEDNDDGYGYWYREWNYNSNPPGWDSTFIDYIDNWIGYDLVEDYDPITEMIIRDNNVLPDDCEAPDFYNPNKMHGTNVAGIIAAKTNNGENIAGIAGGNIGEGKPGISLLPIKVGGVVQLGPNQYVSMGGTSIQFHEAILYADTLGADIINISMGIYSPSDFIESFINDVYDNGNGPLFVASAGNSSGAQVAAPARFNSVIAVGATESNNTYWNSSSYTGGTLELMAPGVDILVFDGTIVDGTSLSTAMVSATAALMLSINPDLTSSEIRLILQETAYKNPIYNYDNNGWNLRYGYGRINTFEAVCSALGYYGDVVVENNAVWDSPQVSTNDIYIDDGITLTLTSTLYMDPTKKIIVQSGGKFIIDGGTVTNYPFCSGDSLKWKGIEVWGDTSKSQRLENGAYHQGYLELKNGATIKNAQTAILLGKTGDYNGSGGGIVKAYNSYLTNNAKSVYFYPFKNMIVLGNDPAFEGNNEAMFRNCEFTINENYFPDSQFYKHADVVKVKGIKFYACDFKRESNNNTFAYCSGIESYDGGLSVHEYGGEPCTFEGLYTGIVIANSSTVVDYDCYIQNSEFTNNSRGIKLNYMTNLVSIRENTFNVGYNEPDKGICGASQAYGIFLDNSNTFVIEDNFFYKYVNAPPNGVYIGVEAYNTQTSSDEIFRNTFSGLTHANHATNQNWKSDNGGDRFHGLAYYCNLQSNNSNDLFFTWKGSVSIDYPVSGVQVGQGNINKSAGNTFTQNVSGYNIYNNTSHGVGYYYDTDKPLEIPMVYNAGSAFVTTHAQTLDAVCGGGGIGHREFSPAEKQGFNNDYINSENNYNSVKSLYQSLEDGGNTQSLNTEVSTSWPNDMWELRAELLGLSPYLSTKVLKTAADKTEVLPESVLFEILSANPDELKKAELMDYLENKEQPLPDYMISILKQMGGGQTAKTVLQNDMARYHREKSRTALQMLIALQYDEVFDYNTYRLWLNRLGDINADRKIVASFVQQNNYTDALALANLFPELYNLQGIALNEHQYYMNMLNFDIILKQENRNPAELNETELALLEQIAEESQENAGVQAKAILEHFYGQHFCNCVDTDVNENKSTSANMNTNQFAEAMGLKIQAEPNPATTWVSFDYELPIGNDKAQLLIRNTEGKQIALFQISDQLGQKVWDTRSLKAGTYIYEFVSGNLKQSGKIIIIK